VVISWLLSWLRFFFAGDFFLGEGLFFGDDLGDSVFAFLAGDFLGEADRDAGDLDLALLALFLAVFSAFSTNFSPSAAVSAMVLVRLSSSFLGAAFLGILII